MSHLNDRHSHVQSFDTNIVFLIVILSSTEMILLNCMLITIKVIELNLDALLSELFGEMNEERDTLELQLSATQTQYLEILHLDPIEKQVEGV